MHDFQCRIIKNTHLLFNFVPDMQTNQGYGFLKKDRPDRFCQ